MTSHSRRSADNRRVRTASLSLQGKRTSNQDRILLFPPNPPSDFFIMAVADGLGGMQAGDKAAEIAVETVKESVEELVRYMNLSFQEASECIVDIYEQANNRIRVYAEMFEKSGSVGTTLTMVALSDMRYVAAHVGDSRFYFLENSQIRQITRDHTLADELLRQGGLQEQDYDSSPFRNQLTRSLGARPSCEVDLIPTAEFGEIDRDCTLLLCSDGFYSRLRDADLSRLVDPSLDLQLVLDSLAEEALQRGSTDNLSAVTAQFF